MCGFANADESLGMRKLRCGSLVQADDTLDRIDSTRYDWMQEMSLIGEALALFTPSFCWDTHTLTHIHTRTLKFNNAHVDQIVSGTFRRMIEDRIVFERIGLKLVQSVLHKNCFQTWLIWEMITLENVIRSNVIERNVLEPGKMEINTVISNET